jgi:hypothetical protein
MPLSPQNLDQALLLLGELLAARKTADYDLVVCGGAALLAAKIVSRSTHDVDVLARKDRDGEVFRAHPLPDDLIQAAAEVARELDLEPQWLNSAASFHFPDFHALPNSFWTDLEAREFGDFLRVRFVNRSGQILLKLYAALNRAETRDLEDLRALDPNVAETEAALRWLLDSVPGLTHRHHLADLLHALGHDELIARLPR